MESHVASRSRPTPAGVSSDVPGALDTPARMATRRPAAGDGSVWNRAKPLYVAAVLTILTYLGLQLLLDLQSILLLLFVSVVLAAAVARPTAMLERRGIPRGAAVLLVQFAVVAVLLALAWFVVPPLVNQLASFAEHLPGYSRPLPRAATRLREDPRPLPRARATRPGGREARRQRRRDGRSPADRPSPADRAAAVRPSDGAGAHDAARPSAQPDAGRVPRAGRAVAPRQDRARAAEDRRADWAHTCGRR